MSDVNIYIHYAGGKYVLASDYDRDTQALKERADAEQEAYDGQRRILDAVKAERDTFKAECVNLNNILDQIRIERDALRAQVEAMLAAPANERAAAFEACPESNCDWGAFYRGWMARAAMQAKP